MYRVACFVTFLLGIGITAVTAQTPQSVDFEVISIEDIGSKAMGDRSLSDFTVSELARLPKNKALRVNAVVSNTIQREQVEPTVRTIITRVTSDRPDADEIALFLYSDRELVNGAFDVAAAEWSTDGQTGGITPEIARSNDRSRYDTSIRVKPNLESFLAQRGREEERGGLSEDRRREIWTALIRAEDRAYQEAERRYPTNANCVSVSQAQANLDRNMAMSDSLVDVFTEQVLEEYGIAEEVEDSITVEGMEEQWPMPEIDGPECP